LKKPTLPLAWLIAIEARVVIASVETYLKYAEAVGLTQSAAVPA